MSESTFVNRRDHRKKGRIQVGWWYDGPEDIDPEERFVDMDTAEAEAPFVEPYAPFMVPAFIERPERRVVSGEAVTTERTDSDG